MLTYKEDFLYDVVVYIGRFQPFHNGHAAVLDLATTRGKKVIVLIGSDNQPISSKNPLPTSVRSLIISRYAKNKHPQTTIAVEGISDHPYDESTWVKNVVSIVDEFSGSKDARIAVISSFDRDPSSNMKKYFPQWNSIQVDFGYHHINATEIREWMYSNNRQKITEHVPTETVVALDSWMDSEQFLYAKQYDQSCKKHIKDQSNFPRINLTVDALVHCEGKILVIRRKNQPGQGLLALPGGFVNADENTEDACLRELQEETGIKEGLLELACVVFDSPNRSSPRGRIVTIVTVFELTKYQIPVANDDAIEAFWLPLNDLKEQDFFEDHFHIIKGLTKNGF